MAQKPVAEIQDLEEIQRKRLEESLLAEFEIEQATPEHREVNGVVN